MVDGHSELSAEGAAASTALTFSLVTNVRTRPMPLLSAALAASMTAPCIPLPPPSMARCFRVPLCASNWIGGIRDRTNSASTIAGRLSCGCDCDPCRPGSSRPMSMATISPQQSRARSVPRLIPPKLSVRSAITHDECCPVVASRPLGTSRAATHAPRACTRNGARPDRIAA